MFAYIVAETEKALAIVRESDASIENVKPLWLPRKKIVSLVETDGLSRRIKTAQNGERLGTPCQVEIDPEFAEKVGVA